MIRLLKKGEKEWGFWDAWGGLVFICRVLQIDQAVVDVRQALRETSFFEGVCMFTFHTDNSCIILT